MVTEKIACVTADREFLGNSLIEYLREQNIKLCIRIKNNTEVANARGQLVNAWTLFNHLSVGESLILSGKRSIWGQKLYLVGLKTKVDEFLIIATTESPETALVNYGKRWQIETLFGCLKSRGFNFESTHITENERISSMIAILAITFVWAHRTGEWLHQQRPIPLKTTIGRPLIRLFRYGLDYLQNLLCNRKVSRISTVRQIIRLVP
ncbi:transposase IS4 family protein [Candidatus Thiomargarita nelsonii]|uniref:Transposase IS4 family protein n=1 Tax=Candidatus Thiomargarita nelsonii TaxID=1003181 RepID=A0A176RVE1_9GAMM|nr:transposase IS4 family protein [Candidatus Thiomargarita nelsonii]